MKLIQYNGIDVLFDDSELSLKKYSIIIGRDIVDSVYYSDYEKIKYMKYNRIVVIYDMLVIKGKIFNTKGYEIFYNSLHKCYTPSVIICDINEVTYYEDEYPILLTTDDKKEFAKWKLIL